MAFDTADENGDPIYHTNVMMCIGTDFAMAGFDIISDEDRRKEIYDRLAEVGRDIISLSHEQVKNFAENVIELGGENGRILAISKRAEDSLTADQKSTIEKSTKIVELSVPTIEMAGGSVRCMLAGIHLARR